MGSSNEAPTSATSEFGYDVFLNFRGQDTRTNFTDHLYSAFEGAGISTFIYDLMIASGKDIDTELLKAIKLSAISVIVLSENYASSRWCLNELQAILEHRRSSQHRVVPVFYKVIPSDVRRQRNSYEDAFYRHMEVFDSERVSAWRAALTEVADLQGFYLAHNGDESKFIDEIVHEVANLLDRKSLYLQEPLFGVDEITDSINSWVRDTSANENLLVMSGISGIGKTTIAKVIFNSNCNNFESSCFVGDMKETSKSNGLQRLGGEKFILAANVGPKKDEEATNERHLVVLDDVSDMNQIELLIKSLLGSQEFLASGKTIITTRRRGLLYDLEDRGHQVRSIDIENLDDDESMVLFSWYAFGTYRPLQAYKNQSEAMVNHCKGLPLALKVLGSSLKNKDIDAWEKTLQKLEDLTSLASSSTTSPPSDDVYLSYKGEDTRNNFISHLDKALTRMGVCTISNDDAIQQNEHLKPETLRKIKQSAISVVVFSKNFTTSPSCLHELVAIVEHKMSSGHQVIPIFYNVYPSDVRREIGHYDNDVDEQRVHLWRNAFTYVANLTGLVLAAGEYESSFIHKIVDEIVKKVDFRPEEKLAKMLLPATGEENKSSSLLQKNICQHYSLGEIKSATQNFNNDLVIGCGGFGNVYKGCINNGSTTLVAIKRLHSMSNQGATEFWAEIEMLSKLRHCNLVSLIGYCNHRKEMALVYEYMSHGSLEYHLHKAGSNNLSWLERLKICIGAARGLDYLHTGAGTQHGVIHRDVKSSNILLNENYAAKLSDFGLAKIAPTNQTHTFLSTGVKGTFGYMDPCYFYTGKLTRKSDVYAFGVVLFEVLCGRPAVDPTLDEEQWGLAAWALDNTREGKLVQITDSRLRGQISTKALKEFAHIAGRCLHSQPNQRPTMLEVLTSLESVLALQQRMDSSAVDENLAQKVKSFVFGAGR